MKKLKKLLVNLVMVLCICTIAPSILSQTVLAQGVEATSLKLSKNKVTLSLGETFTLKVNGTKKKVTWTSSNKAIATVNRNGKVIAKKAGSAVITAKVNKKKFNCKITVKEPSISRKTISLKVGSSATLKMNGAKVKVTWSTSNKSVATVNSSGKVVAKKAGKAVITATVAGRKYKCTVTVTAVKPKYGSVSGNVTYFYNYYRGNVSDTGADVLLIPANGSAKKMPTLKSYTDWSSYLINYSGNKYGVYGGRVDGMGSYTLQNIPVGKYVIFIKSNETTSGYAFSDEKGYRRGIANLVSGYVNRTNANYLGRYVAYNKYTSELIEIRENQTTIFSYDFGITYI